MESTNQILLENIQNSISEVVPKKKIGIAFSGGVDSTLVSKICTDMGFDVVLLTIGFSESHDIIFSKEVNEFLNYSHHVLEIDPETFPKITTDIHKVIDTDNLSWNEVMDSKLENELKMMKAVNVIASEFDVQILQPLLSAKFIEYAKTIPITEKIHSSDDLYRKHIIRKLASDVGVPEISCSKRKKALQYGSKIHKSLLKIR